MKARPAARAKPAKKAKPAATASPKTAPSGLSFALDVKKFGLEPILGAAYLMMDRAYVALEGDKAKTLTVALTPKAGARAADVSAAFTAELQSQTLRWAISKNNRGVREYVAENAVTLASQKPAAPAEQAVEQLTDDQRSEIERLIAEVESEIKDMNLKKVAADPKGVSPSWEAQQEKK